MKSYEGTSDISKIRVKNMLKHSNLERVLGNARKQILIGLPELAKDAQFTKALKKQSLELTQEVKTLPPVTSSSYFSRNYKTSKPVLDNNKITLATKKYLVAGYNLGVKVKQVKVNNPDQETNYSLIVSLSVSGSPQRVRNLLTSLMDTLLFSRPTLLVSTITEVDTNTVNKIVKTFTENCKIPAVINILPQKLTVKINSIHRRTLSQNVNLKYIGQLNCSPQPYLSIIDDDILFPHKNSFEDLIGFLEKNRQLRLTGFNPIPYPVGFLKQIKYQYHPTYYKGLSIFFMALIDVPIAHPELHGSGVLLKLKDHPEQIPHDIVFHDGWLSNMFTNAGKNKSARCPKIITFHHEATSLPRRLYKIQARDKDLKKSLQERWNPYLIKSVTENHVATYKYIYQHLPLDNAALAMLIKASKIQ